MLLEPKLAGGYPTLLQGNVNMEKNRGANLSQCWLSEQLALAKRQREDLTQRVPGVAVPNRPY